MLSVVDEKVVATFFHSTGAWLESLQCERCYYPTLYKIILESSSHLYSRLKVLVMEACGGMGEGINLGPVLTACAQSLKRLKLERCYVGSFATAPRLPNLEVLHICGCSIALDTLCQLASASARLRSFYCNNLLNSNACLDALADHCPQLQILYYAMGSAADASSLVRLLQSCPNLAVVDISSELEYANVSATDAHLTAIVQHCRNLKALSVTSSREHINHDAVHLAVAARARDLTHLCWYECFITNDAPVLLLAENSANLRSLGLDLRDSNVSQAALIRLVSNLSYVVELALDHCELSNDVLRAIAAHCPRLEALHLVNSDYPTEVGIAAVAQGCTALRMVYIKEHDSVVTPLSRLLWRALRPDVEFVYGDQLNAMWAALQDVEREELVVW
jgi:hypothetical protein